MKKESTIKTEQIKAIVGLGNPGPQFYWTPHNIGFLILDALCEQYQGSWRQKHNMLVASIEIQGKPYLLVKPETFMNNSGEILHHLKKSGITTEHLLVVHDEIDFDFGVIRYKTGGSARGHNGLRSIISLGGDNFLRLRVGVGRPSDRSEVGNFVTAPFKESKPQIESLIEQSITMILSSMTP